MAGNWQSLPKTIAMSLIVFTLAISPSFAQEKEARPAKWSEAIEAATPRAPVTEEAVTTNQRIKTSKGVLDYKATAGRLTIHDDGGKPNGSLFYVAYRMDSQSPRPVTFFFNGGPGSPTIWLHMGSFGPKYVKTSSPDATKPAPYRLVDNEHTLLPQSDLVFIDAMGAGLSRPLGDTKASVFFGVDQDVDAFAKAIKRYVSINNLWNAPKYIFGESYGTLRAGALANRLQNDGLDLTGVVLFSSIMNYGSRQPGLDQNHINLLPTYAATAWYHQAIASRPQNLEDHVDKARVFATGPYSSALQKGTGLSKDEMREVAKQMSALTGLSEEFIMENRLRVDLGRFRKELLRSRGVSVGRLDSRFVNFDSDDGGENPEFDPASSYITSAYYALLNSYLTKDLGLKTDLEYKLSARDPSFRWDWSHRLGNQTQLSPNTGLDLGLAMRNNPNLKVLAMNGYYDLATPFFATEFDLSHIPLPDALTKNIRLTYYPSGHMMYLHEPSNDAMIKDLRDWYLN